VDAKDDEEDEKKTIDRRRKNTARRGSGGKQYVNDTKTTRSTGTNRIGDVVLVFEALRMNESEGGRRSE